ncbi:hypothetical protein [Pseudomonas aeruginosa]|uniref:hypothetical protein n=1 Tax=Pseudomonas aeruginosa TaxID=287 RepID=UPI0029356CA3|nr:hypothetical protein [Pseudomonas aeruginosa]MDV2841867.1 hypothetical protein [Pseudomonas aeruginosa]
MTKASECTCPSGDGSLRHPCPAHPAPVEQAGANVGHGHVFPRADGVKMRCGGPGLCSECTADAYRARAALAQPYPKSGDYSDQSWINAGCPPEQPEQEEAERPEVFGLERYRVERTGQGFWPYCVRAGDGTRELFVGHLKQCKRVAAQLATAFEDGKFVAGALRAENTKLSEALDECDGDRWKLRSERDAANARLHEVATACATAEQQRDAALARVADMKTMADNYCALLMDANAKLAEMERQKEFGHVIVSMKGGYKCFEFDEYSHAHSFPEGEHQLYAAPVAQAQHSVPEVSGIGRDFAYPRSVVLYLRTEPTDDDLRAIHDGLRSLAAAPGKEGNDD